MNEFLKTMKKEQSDSTSKVGQLVSVDGGEWLLVVGEIVESKVMPFDVLLAYSRNGQKDLIQKAPTRQKFKYTKPSIEFMFELIKNMEDQWFFEKYYGDSGLFDGDEEDERIASQFKKYISSLTDSQIRHYVEQNPNYDILKLLSQNEIIKTNTK